MPIIKPVTELHTRVWMCGPWICVTKFPFTTGYLKNRHWSSLIIWQTKQAYLELLGCLLVFVVLYLVHRSQSDLSTAVCTSLGKSTTKPFQHTDLLTEEQVSYKLELRLNGLFQIDGILGVVKYCWHVQQRSLQLSKFKDVINALVLTWPICLTWLGKRQRSHEQHHLCGIQRMKVSYSDRLVSTAVE